MNECNIKKNNQEFSKKILYIDLDKEIKVEGLTNVIESNDDHIILNIGYNNILQINGSNLSFGEVNLEQNKCLINGKIFSLKYIDKKSKKLPLKTIFKKWLILLLIL